MPTITKPSVERIAFIVNDILSRPRFKGANIDLTDDLVDHLVQTAPRSGYTPQDKWLYGILQDIAETAERKPNGILYGSSDLYRRAMSTEDCNRERDPMPEGTLPNIGDDVICLVIVRAMSSYRKWQRRHRSIRCFQTETELVGFFLLAFLEAYHTTNFGEPWKWGTLLQGAYSGGWQYVNEWTRKSNIYRTDREGVYSCPTCETFGKNVNRTYPFRHPDGAPNKDRPRCGDCFRSNRPESTGRLVRAWRRSDDMSREAIANLTASERMSDPARIVADAEQYANELRILRTDPKALEAVTLFRGMPLVSNPTERARLTTKRHRLIRGVETEIRNVKRSLYIPFQKPNVSRPVYDPCAEPPRIGGPKAKRTPFCYRDENLTEYERRLKDLRMRPNEYLADGSLKPIVL